MSETHLWETDHPYYCAEGNFYTRGNHNLCESWQEFHDLVGDWDPDMNLLFRWDWFRPEDVADDDHSGDRLLTFWVGQRKALQYSYECPITVADEPAVREWLEKCARTITALWAPLDLGLVLAEGEQR